MSKGKIAPILDYVCARLAAHDHTEARKARAELRALLAVARAAERVDLGGNCSPDTGCIACALTRALSRLKRASGTGRGKA